MVRLAPRATRAALALLAPLLLARCTDDDIRGDARPSADGQTYLIVADDNGGKCGPLTVDGRRWPHAIGAPGAVRPGPHVIACGSDITVQVDSGTTYRFDYWGP